MLVELVILLALHADDKNEAEQLFRKMETKLTSAKSLETAFEAKMEGLKFADTKVISLKGSLVFAEGNKSHLEISGEYLPKVANISDGTKMQAVVDDKPQAKKDVPKKQTEIFWAVITRSGLTVPLLFIGAPAADYLFFASLDKEAKIDDMFKVSDFKLGKKEKVGNQEAQVVEYKLQVQGRDEMAVSVWLDTKTDLPLKRVLTGKKGDDKVTITETYSKMKIDAKIDPKKFELPKD
jgi:hypothetical protein